MHIQKAYVSRNSAQLQTQKPHCYHTHRRKASPSRGGRKSAFQTRLVPIQTSRAFNEGKNPWKTETGCFLLPSPPLFWSSTCPHCFFPQPSAIFLFQRKIGTRARAIHLFRRFSRYFFWVCEFSLFCRRKTILFLHFFQQIYSRLSGRNDGRNKREFSRCDFSYYGIFLLKIRWFIFFSPLFIWAKCIIGIEVLMIVLRKI